MTETNRAQTARPTHETNFWPQVCQYLRRQLGEEVFEQWIIHLNAPRLEKKYVRLLAPSPFHANWVATHYERSILHACRRANPQIERILIDSAPTSQRRSPPTPKPAPIELPLDPRLSFDNFVKGASNRDALKLMRALAADRNAAPRPVFIHGDVGLGKTHLLQALASHHRQAGERVVYLSAVHFRHEFVKALRQKETSQFKDWFVKARLLILDDIQFLSGDATQSEFDHIFAMMNDLQSQIVISANAPPSALEKLGKRQRSRLASGLAVQIQPPDYELRRAILKTKMRAMNPPLNLDPDIIAFLARHITPSVRELEGTLHRIALHLPSGSGPVSHADLRAWLCDLIRARPPRVSVDAIQKTVARHYNLSQNELLSSRRSRDVARPRQIAMFLAKKLTARSLPDIGRLFGGRDHTTVLYAVRRIEDLKEGNRPLAADIDSLIQQITA